MCNKFYKTIEKELSLANFFIRYCDSPFPYIINYSFPKLIPSIPDKVPTRTLKPNLIKSYTPSVGSAPNKTPVAYKAM